MRVSSSPRERPSRSRHVHDLDVEIHQGLTTAMLVTIRQNANGFLKNATPKSSEAAGFLRGTVDIGMLREMGTRPSPR